MRNILLSLFPVLLAPGLWAAEFPLLKDGKAVSQIIVAEDAPLPVQYAARELAKYLAKISAGETPSIAPVKSDNRYPVFLGTTLDQTLTAAAGVQVSGLKEGGFAIRAGKNGLYIIGGDPVGTLYGAYEILKEYGGIRWIFPGEEGEYFQPRTTIAVSEQNTVRNPYLEHRQMELNSVVVNKPYFDTREWQVRNGMTVKCSLMHLNHPQYGKHMQELGARGVPIGGHILTILLFGKYPKEAELKELFAQHPEYFPMINGKRILLDDQKYQPCTSNPEVLNIMAKNLISYAIQPGSDGLIIIGNNDGTGWCECQECRKIDPPDEAAKNRMATRYWTLVQNLARRVWEIKPDARLGGWAYQNFWMPPSGIKLDPRLTVCLSFNNQCWRHPITDPNCSVNREFLKLYLDWKKLGVKAYNRDEIAADGSVGSNFLPAERVLYQNFKDYPGLGLIGSGFCIVPPPPDAEVYKPLRRGPISEHNLNWAAMWQTNYLSAQFMFDIHQDFDQLYEECNRLYYGRGWDGGMKKFRALLSKAFRETPGCMGWGLGAPLGRCLDQPGVQDQLKALLVRADEAAAGDPDPRARMHVRRERDIFAYTWEAARKTYLENYKELNVYRKTSPITIDGELSEQDWKTADVMTGFKHPPWTRTEPEPVQTYFRAIYEPDSFYLAVEAMEPAPGQIIAEKLAKDGPYSKIGNNLEIFLHYPDMADQYYHYIINSAGSIIDARHGLNNRDIEYDSGVEYAVKVLPDRWTLETRIPTAGIGMKCFDGATWKLNVARCRKVSEKSELSSWCGGHFHGVDNFGIIKFTPTRIAGLFQGHDPAAWKNASFNEVCENEKLPPFRQWKGHWKTSLVPVHWSCDSNAAGSTLLHKDSSDNYFVEFEGGIIGNWYVAPVRKLRITFRASGNGKARLWTGRYEHGKNKGYPFKGQTGVLEFAADSDVWKTYSLTVDKGAEPRLYVRFFHQKGTVRLDDVIVTPIGEE